MGRQVQWSDEDRVQVAAWLVAGKSMARIARLLGVTRGVVIGRIHRDGTLHAFVGQVVVDKKIERDESQVKRRARTVPIVQPPIRTTLPRSPFECVQETHPLQPLVVEAPPSALPLVELQRDSCRWPVWEDAAIVGGQLFCARQRAGEHTSYCVKHFHIAHPPAVRRQGRTA